MKLKKIIKNKLKKLPKYDESKLKKQIDKFDYISFDIYDTLIKRDVESPKDVFLIISKKAENEAFYNDRINAEKIAREKSNKEEIKIEDIYNVLVDEMKYNKNDAQKLLDLEIEIEKKISTKNIEIYDIYKYCISKNKKIIIVSNMYLSENVIKAILHDNGYDKYDKLFVSSEYGKKKDKSLFKTVLETLNISGKSMLHIGDSYKNDVRGAKRNGIHTYLIPKRINKITHNENEFIIKEDAFQAKSIDSFINNRLIIKNDDFFNFGYQSFGLLLFGFNKYMHDDLEKKGITDIYFFSRDGYIMKKVYDVMYPNDKIKSHYIYVSRRSLRVPQLWTAPELEDVLKTFPLAKLLTVETFIKNLGLNPEEYEEQLKKFNLTLDTQIEKKNILKTEDIVKFYAMIKNDAIEHSKEECNLLIDYFKQEGLEGKVAVVDIGWHGSLQYFIQKLSKEIKYNLDMEGYYIGLAKEAKQGIKSHGYVIDINSETNSCDSWKAFNGLAETLFLAQEGSTQKFERVNDKIIPILYDYEYEDEKGNKEIEAIRVKSLQEGAVAFSNDFSKSILSTFDFNSFTAYRRIYLTGLHPVKKDLKMFSDFRFLEEQIDYLAMPCSIFKYLIKPKKLKKDLLLSRWKIGFLKKLFKIKLPYIKMYKLLRKISG